MAKNVLEYLSLDIIYSSKLTIFLSENRLLLGTNNVRGQISENVFTPNGLFFATRAVLKIGRYHSDIRHTSVSWGPITHVKRIDQSRERKYLMDYNYRYSFDPGAASHDKSPNGSIVLGIKSPPLFRITPPTPPLRGIYNDRCITAS